MTRRLVASLSTAVIVGLATAAIIIASNWLRGALGDLGVAVSLMVAILAFLVVFVVDLVTELNATP